MTIRTFYPCSGDDFGDQFSFCGYTTESYADCDTHEENNLGHLMTSVTEVVQPVNGKHRVPATMASCKALGRQALDSGHREVLEAVLAAFNVKSVYLLPEDKYDEFEQLLLTNVLAKTRGD